MFLRLKTPFLSIVNFPDVALPQFTVLTGVNGSGKTHLLKAITNGSINVDIAPNIHQDIRYFDWHSLVPSDAGPFNGQAIFQQQEQVYSQIESRREQ